MPKISLVVGNGLSMSFGYHTGLAESYNSQEPLGWAVKCPSTGGLLLDSLGSRKRLFQDNFFKPHFDVFKAALDSSYVSSLGLKPFITVLEARHFLTIAFSEYSKEQKNHFDTDWSWFKWLKFHRDEIDAAFSLNYDLLLETSFDRLQKDYYSLQLNHHGYGIPLVKPHGSVDFEITPNSISYTPCYPLRNYVDLNDTEIIRLQEHELLMPRRQALCIIPNESNKYSDYQWVAPANEWFESRVQLSDFCVFIGISYFDCDRYEIDKILDSLNKECVIIVANPNPPQAFLEKISDRPHLIWSSYSGPLDEDGNLLNLKSPSNGKGLTKCFCRSGLPYKYCSCHN